MKKISSISILFVLLLLLSACGGSTEACFLGVRSPEEAAGRIQSAVSIYMAEQYG